MSLFGNLMDKIFGQKERHPQMSERQGTSPLNFKKFEEEAASIQENMPDQGMRAEKDVNELRNKLQEKTEKLGEKVLEKGKEWKEKATEFGDYLSDKMEDLMQKAEAEAAKEPKKPESFFEKAHRKGQEYEARANDTQRTFQDSLNDAKKSMLKDDFFAKAAKFANNEYVGNQSKPIILPTDANRKTQTDKGISDSDDLIEDAIIEK